MLELSAAAQKEAAAAEARQELETSGPRGKGKGVGKRMKALQEVRSMLQHTISSAARCHGLRGQGASQCRVEACRWCNESRGPACFFKLVPQGAAHSWGGPV